MKDESKAFCNERVRVVGLTGGIASGKTEVTNALRAASVYVIDADEISRELTAPGTEIEKELTRMFPKAQNSGGLDRRALRELIATDAQKKLELEAFLHPLIIGGIKSKLTRSAVLSAPLLFETGLSSLCDFTVSLVAPARLRVERLIKRDGVTRLEAEHIVAAQIPDEYRAALSDYCIRSDADMKKMCDEAVALIKKLLVVD